MGHNIVKQWSTASFSLYSSIISGLFSLALFSFSFKINVNPLLLHRLHHHLLSLFHHLSTQFHHPSTKIQPSLHHRSISFPTIPTSLHHHSIIPTTIPTSSPTSPPSFLNIPQSFHPIYFLYTFIYIFKDLTTFPLVPLNTFSFLPLSSSKKGGERWPSLTRCSIMCH